jgi:hypothetical protein
MIAAHPGWPALLNSLQNEAIMKMMKAAQMIQKMVPGGLPSVVCSTCAKKALCANGMNDVMESKLFGLQRWANGR